MRSGRFVATIGIAGAVLVVAEPAPGDVPVQFISSADGAWVAGIDASGQVSGLMGPNPSGADHVFETLVYLAVGSGGLVSQRMEFLWEVTEQTILAQQAVTVLERDGSPIRVRIRVQMHGGADGGAEVRITATNTGVIPSAVKLFYYADLDVAGTSNDDEVIEVFGFNGVISALVGVDELAAAGPLWFRNLGPIKSHQVTYFPHLRVALDGGLEQLSGEDETNELVFSDHTVALAGDTVVLAGGQATRLRVGIGGSDAGTSCPWDCAASPDEVVGTADLLALLSQWGTAGDCDVNGGGIGTTDLLAVLNNWGACP